MAFMDFTRTALKNLFSKPATRQYPQVPREYPARSRGHVEIDMDACILCGLCSRKCPSGAITVDRAAGTWSIDPAGCLWCCGPSGSRKIWFHIRSFCSIHRKPGA